jgi:predicted RNase H-like HicB family nuclease
MRYIAFVHKDPDSSYGVMIPDMPGCFSAGETLDEAVANAVEALSGHVRLLESDGDPVPPARTIDEIIADPELADERQGAIISAVPLVRDRGSSTRINVSLDLGLLEAIDDAARRRKQTRSAYLASAARRELMDQV